MEDDEGGNGMVDGGEGDNNRMMMHENDNEDKEEFINRDGLVEWEDFIADYWRMLPPPLCTVGGRGGKGG
jgi:hypothetical protein